MKKWKFGSILDIWSHLTVWCYIFNAYFMQHSWCRDRKLNFIYFNCKLLQFAPSVLLEFVESYVVWVRYWYKKPFEVKKAILLHGKQSFWIPNVRFTDQCCLHSSIKGLWIYYSMTWYTANTYSSLKYWTSISFWKNKIEIHDKSSRDHDVKPCPSSH